MLPYMSTASYVTCLPSPPWRAAQTSYVTSIPCYDWSFGIFSWFFQARVSVQSRIWISQSITLTSQCLNRACALITSLTRDSCSVSNCRCLEKVINELINVLSLPVRRPWNDVEDHRHHHQHTQLSQLDLVFISLILCNMETTRL